MRVVVKSVGWLGVMLAAMPIASRGEDWPKWRGMRGDGSWQGPRLPERWPEGGLRVVWSQPIGSGYAGVSVADGRVYTMDLESPIDRTQTVAEDQTDGRERVHCFDAKTGQPLWCHSYPVRYGKLDYGNGPRCTPTIHEGKVYTLGAVGHLLCLDAQTGQVLWQRDTVRQDGAVVPTWGFAASPVIDGKRVIVHVGARPGGCVIAYDRHTGQEIWRSLEDPAGYCTPVFINAPSGRQLIVWTPKHIHGLEAETGKPLWKVPYDVRYGVSIATPIYHEGLLFVTGYWDGSKAIRLGQQPTDAELAWTDNRHLRGLMAQPLYRDGLVYSFDKQFGLTCFDLKTGKKLWDDENQLTPAGRNPHASVIWLKGTDRILALNAVGELIQARLSERGYEELSRTKVLNGRVWSHPAFAGRFLFAHTDGAENWRNSGPHHLLCVELAASD